MSNTARYSWYFVLTIFPFTAHACMFQPPVLQRIVIPLVFLFFGVICSIGAFKIFSSLGTVWRNTFALAYVLCTAQTVYLLIVLFNPSGAVDCNRPFTLESARFFFIAWHFLLWQSVHVSSHVDWHALVRQGSVSIYPSLRFQTRLAVQYDE